jgi:small subunit ribosomal protein S3
LAVERQVVSANLKKVKVKEYLSRELEKAGIGEIDIQRTPMDTRVIIYAQRPGIVIGKKGTTIKSLTETLKVEYGLDNPQIEVNDLVVPALSAPVMARSIASSLERGYHFRRAAYSALRDIMNAGAIGVQITLAGKLTGERSRMEKFVDGYIKHCGEPADRLVLKGFAEAAPKLGRIGVKVKILPPGAKLPDNITIGKREAEAPVDVETPPEAAEALVPEGVEVQKEGEPKEVKKPKKAKKVEKPKKATKAKKPKAKEPKAKKSKAKVVVVDLLDKPAKEIMKEIKKMGKKELNTLLAKEVKGKNRKTVVDGIKKLISKE